MAGHYPGTSSQPDSAARVRIDKWLWAARFYKTRSLASQAVDGGKVRLNGDRAKPSKEVKVGDWLEIGAGDAVFVVDVLALSDRRGPAPEAQTLYAERPDSLAARLAHREQRRFVADPSDALQGRPTKRDRRMIHRFTGEG